MLTQDKNNVEIAEQLEQTRRQLLQSEKLASIGQLAAGVAHEINNPVGYVQSNLRTLGDYLNDLLRVTDAIENANSIDELKGLRSSVDYEFLRSDLADLLRESMEGVDRIKTIISCLKDFSRTEENAFKPADLHNGITTTLNVVNNEVKYKAQVELDFGEVPAVDCVISQINQVVMNLLVNAAQAIEQFGRIDVRTGVEGEEAWFEVEDNGSGIASADLAHLFEPFYTTKPAGKGTGLGLAVSKTIIDNHRGRIEVISGQNRGSRFRVWLPLRQETDEKQPTNSE